MNSMVLSVVSIDGSGNGEGLIKVPMLNNIKLGVTLSGIQVAEGGCIVAGRAELSGVDVALLNQQQRDRLAQAYAVFNQALDKAYENAATIAETYNSLIDLYEKIAVKTQTILDKISEGKKISKSEQKELATMKQKAKEDIDKQIAYFTKKFGSEDSDEIIKLVNLASQSCTCEAYTETSEPKKGPNADAEERIFYDDGCKKCLEEDKKKQQEMAKLAKIFEAKLKAIKGKKMECGCFKWGTILKDLETDDKDCEDIVAKMNQMREDFKSRLYANIEVLEKLEGQVMIGENCINKFSLEISNNVVMNVTSSPTDEYNEPNREIIDNILKLYNDRTKNPLRYLTIKTDNNEQARLVEKWLFEGAKGEEPNPKNGSDLKYKSGREYGWLSASEESQNPCDIGYDKAGGCSYGKHQMAVKTGKLNEFISWLSINYKEDLRKDYKEFTETIINAAKDVDSRKGCKECDLTKAFNKVCIDSKFIGLAHKFIAEKNYKPVYDKIMNLFSDTKLFRNLNAEDEEALKEMCYSLGVQHGGAFRIFEMALLKDYTHCSESEILDSKNSDCSASKFPQMKPTDSEKTDMTTAANKLNMKEYVKRVYAARKLYVKKNNVEGWKNMVKNRYKNEDNKIFKQIYKN